jgi:hypothetical protein
MRTALTALAVTVLFSSLSVRAQIPGVPSGPRFEIAEVRACDDVPARSDLGFAAAVAGPAFSGETSAVIAKFQTDTLPADAAISIVWMRSGKPAPKQLLSEPVAIGEFESGAYSMLTNRGAPIDPGSYYVAVVDADGRIYRSLQFAVRPPVAAAPRPPAAVAPRGDEAAVLVPYRLETVEFTYPAGYAVDAFRSKAITGVTFVRPFAASALVVAFRTGGRYDLRTEATSLLARISAKLGTRARNVAGNAFALTSYEVRELGRVDLGGHPAYARLVTAQTSRRWSATIALYEIDLFGRTADVGCMSFAFDGDAESGDHARQGAEDLANLILSIRPADDAPPGPDDAPSRKTRRSSRPLDIAAYRP